MLQQLGTKTSLMVALVTTRLNEGFWSPTMRKRRNFTINYTKTHNPAATLFGINHFRFNDNNMELNTKQPSFRDY